MKKYLSLFILLFSLNSFSSISIVSDLDDTIKITNSGEEIDGAINAFFKNDVFTGMTDFFSAARLYTNELHILSASPKFLRAKITSTLRLKKIEFESLILKDGIGGQPKLDYKIEALKKLLDSSSDDFIFMGDDVGQDPEAYLTIKKLYPDRVLAIYIHVISGRKVPADVVEYWTTFDLFLREQMAGRMLPSWVAQAGEVTLLEKKMKLIFPDFAKCPTSRETWTWQLASEYQKLVRDVTAKLTQYCQARNSSN